MAVEEPGTVVAGTVPPPQAGAEGVKSEAKAEQTAVEEVLELDLSTITKSEDGKFELRDPENPEKTVYRGDTVDELLKNVVKGVRDKDKFISELKAKSITSDHLKGERTPKGERDDDSAIVFPDPDEILANVAKEMKIDAAMFSWGREEWKQHEADNGAVETLELKNAVGRAREVAQGRVAEENVRILNNVSLEEETEAIREFIAKKGLDVDEIDWDKVFKEAITDPKNYKKSGIRRGGSVFSRAQEEIYEALKSKIRKEESGKLESELADGRTKGKKMESPGSTAGAPKPPKIEPAKTMEEAYERALKAFK